MRQHLLDRLVGIETVAGIVHTRRRRYLDRDMPVIEAEISDSSQGFGLTAGTGHSAACRQQDQRG